WLASPRRVWIALAAIVAALAVYACILPVLLNVMVGAAFLLKLLVSAALLVPLGFAMGMPFPTGLRALCGPDSSAAESNTVEWAWAMNAGASVLGSVLAIVIAMEFGLTLTLVCGAAAYAFAIL